MARGPEREPNFNFELENRAFNPEVIAERVIWPLVDELSRRNWRTESYRGQEFVFPARIYHQEEFRNVMLQALNELDFESSERPLEVVFAEIHIENVKTGWQRKYIIDDICSGDESSDLEGIDPYNTLAKSTTVYTFGADGELDIEVYQKLETEDGCCVWLQSTKDEISDEPAILREADLEQLGIAMRALNAPPHLSEVLWNIKDGRDPRGLI